MNNSQNKSTRLYIITALFAAMIFIVTAYLFHIPTPATGGYIHLGDAFVYLAASMLPTPFAIAAAGIGEALSDALTGSVVYAIPTLLIKSAMVICFSSLGKKIITKRNIAATVLAGVICIVGYYFTAVILYHNFISPLVDIPANLIQASASAVIYVLIGNAFDRLNIRNRISTFTN
jgi:uncharacterized repeat protein (TIGR04002 family)